MVTKKTIKLKECPFCHEDIDMRGYVQHTRACRDKYEAKEHEEEKEPITETNEGDNTMPEDDETKEKKTVENTLKNVESPKPTGKIAKVAGLIAIIAVMILMLILPKSKESTTPGSNSQTNRQTVGKRNLQRR